MTYPQLSLYIDGEFIQGGGRREQDIINPATHEVIGKLPHATREDLDRALTAAARAFGIMSLPPASPRMLAPECEEFLNPLGIRSLTGNERWAASPWWMRQGSNL